MDTPDLTRRLLLTSGLGAGAAIGLASVASPAAASSITPASTEAAVARVRIGRRSANGFPVERGADRGGAVWTTAVAGSSASVAVHLGDVATLLVHVVRRFHYEIGTLTAGDVVGFAPGGSGAESNHASGTAVDIRPGWYPAGARGGLVRHELAVVRDVLAECDGVIAWGGDLPVPHESHFHIAVGPGDPALARVAAAVRERDQTPGLGAGVVLAGA